MTPIVIIVIVIIRVVSIVIEIVRIVTIVIVLIAIVNPNPCASPEISVCIAFAAQGNTKLMEELAQRGRDLRAKKENAKTPKQEAGSARGDVGLGFSVRGQSFSQTLSPQPETLRALTRKPIP